MKFFETKKDYKKAFRTLIQAIMVILALYILAQAFFTFRAYRPYKEGEVRVDENSGFIAISYLGVDRNGTSSLISTARLEEELSALRANGYVTLTQQDILDYYKNDKKLPEKSLFLMFEDGRRDTAIFAQDSLEKNNYIGTILTYAEKFKDNEQKFLIPKDLLSLKNQSFWEMGTNGYRLSYINVYDRYEHYLGQLSSLEYNKVKQYLGRDYNQYLMDFIRDENDIPLESAAQMSKRITYDYELMNEAYKNGIGQMPQLYVLMHANTGKFGNNDKVSAVNEANIMTLFQMNFNREGFSQNTKESSIYDLTRMQTQAYWYTNHLLMRIQDDTKKKIQFVDGDSSKKKDWNTVKGASEFKEDKIIITSLPENTGLLQLKDQEFDDFVLNTDLTGNKLGIQSLYLRADDSCKNAIKVELNSNVLFLLQIIDGKEKKIGEINLDQLDGVQYASIEEDQKAALVEEYKIRAKYAKQVGNSHEIAQKNMQEAEKIRTKSVAQGANEYIPEIQISEPGNRHLQIVLHDDVISVFVDGKSAFQEQKVTKGSGQVFLEASFAGYGYSQRNISDDVYDGVFEKLEITSYLPEQETVSLDTDKLEIKYLLQDEEAMILYTNKLHKWEFVKAEIVRTWNGVINWFINTF